MSDHVKDAANALIYCAAFSALVALWVIAATLVRICRILEALVPLMS